MPGAPPVCANGTLLFEDCLSVVATTTLAASAAAAAAAFLVKPAFTAAASLAAAFPIKSAVAVAASAAYSPALTAQLGLPHKAEARVAAKWSTSAEGHAAGRPKVEYTAGHAGSWLVRRVP